jgi:hypothetical protein
MTAETSIGATAAELIDRYGQSAVLVRPTGAFDPTTQASASDDQRVAVRAVLRDRLRREGEGSVRTVEAILSSASLAATGFDGPPRPGDRLAMDGAERAIVAVETLSVAAAATLFLLRLGR